MKVCVWAWRVGFAAVAVCVPNAVVGDFHAASCFGCADVFKSSSACMCIALFVFVLVHVCVRVCECSFMVRDKQGCHFNVKVIVWLFVFFLPHIHIYPSVRTYTRKHIYIDATVLILAHTHPYTRITAKLLKHRHITYKYIRMVYRIYVYIYYIYPTRKPTVRNDDSPILLSLRNRIKYKTNTHFTTFWLAIYLSEKENTRCSFHHILFIVFIFLHTYYTQFAIKFKVIFDWKEELNEIIDWLNSEIWVSAKRNETKSGHILVFFDQWVQIRLRSGIF